jgi:hypothetical protein
MDLTDEQWTVLELLGQNAGQKKASKMRLKATLAFFPCRWHVTPSRRVNSGDGDTPSHSRAYPHSA